ncbi:MAG TPA: hypothetical protein VG711_07005, partial [Phycisphaerales bacterium]|nr:hypothetical protein [Phycisphaerales bacterium]
MHEVTRTLTEHYESCLAAHGPTAQGMDWGTNESRLNLRFSLMGRAMGLFQPAQQISIIDAGCGCGL